MLALGGQGGATLTGWIAAAAEKGCYFVQTTSVPGVAQRTGATVFYLEMLPREAFELGHPPALALMPTPGDVDLVVAAELAEAGRAILRSFVSPERTTLIASTHREYATVEKVKMADGRANSSTIEQTARRAAKRYIAFDMQRLAERENSVVSAVLLGAVAGSGMLPFGEDAFEAAISESGRSVEENLRAFRAGRDGARDQEDQEPRKGGDKDSLDTAIPALPAGETVRSATMHRLRDRIQAKFPAPVQGTLWQGVKRLVDYQDPAYAGLYLTRVKAIAAIEPRQGRGPAAGSEAELTKAVARYLALWMSYEDTIRVAALKIRRSRFDRVERAGRLSKGELVYVTEFMHPRAEEICDTLPVWLGNLALNMSVSRRLLDWLTRRGRKVRTNTISGFLLLYGIAALRRFRRHTLRYRRENERIEAWLEEIRALSRKNYGAAVALAECQRLIKGYGDTYEKGWRNFSTVTECINRIGAESISEQVIRRLRDAALANESGVEFEQAVTAALSEDLEKV